jgi:hypothetical protein
MRGGNYGNGKQTLDISYERGVNDKGSNSRYYDLDLWFNKMIDEL